MFALLLTVKPASDSIRHTPGRPMELVMYHETLHCPMCTDQKVHVRWDMHDPNHGETMRANASGYKSGFGRYHFSGTAVGGPVDCMSNPGGHGCPGPH
eukprot:CAMPEP_0196730766 /NCGR_PEP_ID=MMETSP1091-20130531/10732_1 /TAXON_ID=302021 /ORGANISM="Rhodomonas sp., Strain CCMP768" /LENGTH=97 /DNA_ID=CAMNT_0042073831 /DNA_START=9 /DNA_END=302 /DNA_ORIENTATION=-